MNAYQVGLVVQRDPLRLAIVLDNGEGVTAAEAHLTPEQARGLGLALVAAAAKDEAKNEQASSEVAQLEALYRTQAAAQEGTH